jgi:hypothetical protein
MEQTEGTLVLVEKVNRHGEVKGFDVVRAEQASPVESLDALPEGDYTTLSGGRVQKFSVSYRTVQDVVQTG